MKWLVAALLACTGTASAAVSPAAEQALRAAAPRGEKTEEMIRAASGTVDRLVSGGLPEREAVKLVIGGLQAGRGVRDIESLSAVVVAAVAGGLKPDTASAVARAALGHGVGAPALGKLLAVSREAIAAGATSRETRHVAESALRRGGEEGAASALESFKTLVAEGVDERDARRAVLRVVAQKADSRALQQQARSDIARSLEEKKLERERAREEDRRQRDEEKRDERGAAAGGGAASGGGGEELCPPDGDSDPSDPDCD